MALIVVFENISQLADVSDYRVGVYVNHTQIHANTVLQGHKREDGWQALVKQWAKGLKVAPFKPRKAGGVNADLRTGQRDNQAKVAG